MIATQRARRVAAGFSVGALSLVAAMGAAADASAATAQTEWVDGNSKFVMTVSDSTPRVGDTLTFANTFQRKWADEYIYWVKYTVPSCLRYVDGSAGWENNPSMGNKMEVHESTGPNDPAYVQINAPDVVTWRVPGLGAGWGAARSVSMQFTVTSKCATGEALTPGLAYKGSLGTGNYADRGPSFTVPKGTGGGSEGGGNEGGGSEGGGSQGGSNEGGSGSSGTGSSGPSTPGVGGIVGGTGSLDLGSLAGNAG